MTTSDAADYAQEALRQLERFLMERAIHFRFISHFGLLSFHTSSPRKCDPCGYRHIHCTQFGALRYNRKCIRVFAGAENSFYVSTLKYDLNIVHSDNKTQIMLAATASVREPYGV